MPRLDVEVRAAVVLWSACTPAAITLQLKRLKEVSAGRLLTARTLLLLYHCSQPLGRHLDAATAIQRH
jgi:hypothetical protein